MKNLSNFSRSHRVEGIEDRRVQDEIVRKSSSSGAAFRRGWASSRTTSSGRRSNSAGRGAKTFFIKRYLPRDGQCRSGYVSNEQKVPLTWGLGVRPSVEAE